MKKIFLLVSVLALMVVFFNLMPREDGTSLVKNAHSSYASSDQSVTYENYEIPEEFKEKYPELENLASFVPGKTLILFDTSTEIGKVVNQPYLELAKWFIERTSCYSFDSSLHEVNSINNISFAGDCNVLMAVNMAKIFKYENAIVFSAMEQNIPKAKYMEDNGDLNIFIITPVEITELSAFKQLQKAESVKSLTVLQVS